MKLIVTIPALNEEATIGDVIREVPRTIEGVDRIEVLVLDDGSTDGTVAAALAAGADYVVSNSRNRGLAFTFQRALEEALARGADVIVNTDADNHYDQTRIPELIQPILEGRAEIVVGSRLLRGLKMKPANKHGNRLANFILQRLLRIDGIDVSSGYRAYSRRAALGLNVFSGHTYTHETLFSALDQGLKIVSVPLPARAVERPSRLISSLPRHVWRAGTVVLQSILRYRPFQAYGALGLALVVLGLVPFTRYMYLFATGEAAGHVQSLIAGAALVLFGAQVFAMGLLATAVGWNRRLLEEVLLRLKEEQLSRHAEADSGAAATATLAPVVPLAARGREEKRKVA
ncbi:MAG TPA: glycosyltransferase family 2 protein [Dehalococcoidia bacterium]|nr:glycosyltransferase family 2 protein [Dehalococcoidia bacterium]